MAKRTKQSEPSEREAGIVKVVDPFVDVPVEVNTIPEPPPPAADSPPRVSSGPSLGERVGRFFRFLFRLVFLVIALSIIGVALYIVLPLLYQRYIRPVEQNTAQMMELQTQQEQTEQELADLQTRLGTIETVQNQHDGSLTELDQRLSDIETEITARTQSLAALESLQSELEAQNQAVSAELERQINLLKAMELLSRARLSMYQSNFGLAQQDVQIARDLLMTIRPDAPESLADDLDTVVLRLDLTLSNLPDFPVAASDDLDIAWQILLSGRPREQTPMSETPTPASTLSTNPEVTFTPTAQVTVQPSVTP
jgi:Tfp pilus assembly protein PilE